MPRTDKSQLERTALAGIYDQAPVVVAVGAVSARNAITLTQGEWEVESDTACFILQGDNTVVATTSDVPLPAGKTKRIEVLDGNTAFVAVIQAFSAGSLFLTNPRGPASS